MKVSLSMDDLELLLRLAKTETNPQARAVQWGECILYILSLEDIREGLTFDELRKMSDGDATRLADQMQSVFEMRNSWRDSVPEPRAGKNKSFANRDSSKVRSGSTKFDEVSEAQSVSKRKTWPPKVSQPILTKCHFRCSVCPEHRRVADIHQIDGDNSNSVEMNGIALCKLCHTDAHTTSTMQRNLQADHLREFKKKWEEVCEKLASSLTYGDSANTNVYYMNVHRLDGVLRELGENSVLTSKRRINRGVAGATARSPNATQKFNGVGILQVAFRTSLALIKKQFYLRKRGK